MERKSNILRNLLLLSQLLTGVALADEGAGLTAICFGNSANKAINTGFSDVTRHTKPEAGRAIETIDGKVNVLFTDSYRLSGIDKNRQLQYTVLFEQFTSNEYERAEAIIKSGTRYLIQRDRARLVSKVESKFDNKDHQVQLDTTIVRFKPQISQKKVELSLTDLFIFYDKKNSYIWSVYVVSSRIDIRVATKGLSKKFAQVITQCMR